MDLNCIVTTVYCIATVTVDLNCIVDARNCIAAVAESAESCSAAAVAAARCIAMTVS